MDLNQLYSDHQAAHMRASSSVSAADRDICLDDAADLAATIGQFQQSLGAAAALAWTAKASQRAVERRLEEAAARGARRPAQASIPNGEGFRRQKEMTHLSLLVLGREAGLAFMNDVYACLGGRPIDLVEESSENVPMIEALLRQAAEFETARKPMQQAC